MGQTARIPRVTFAGGEMSETAIGRADTGRYQISVEKLENFVTLKAGAVTRAPGTRFVLPLKDQTQRGKLLTFRRSSDDYYALVINGGVARFVRQGGFVVDLEQSDRDDGAMGRGRSRRAARRARSRGQHHLCRDLDQKAAADRAQRVDDVDL
jgi:hypothetical protein